MNKRIKALWIDALKSGDFKQGKGRLKALDGDGEVAYCCLGVLCEIASQEDQGSFSDKHGLSKDVYFFNTGEDVYTTSFPEPNTLEWAGLANSDAWNLVDLNDGGGKTFEDIADVITNL